VQGEQQTAQHTGMVKMNTSSWYNWDILTVTVLGRFSN
jgi:hypothetical protein